MSANVGTDCQMLIAGIKLWFIRKNWGFCINTKNPMHRPEKVGFFPPLIQVVHHLTWCLQ